MQNLFNESYEQGYESAIQDLKTLSEAVDTLKDFAETVGGSSSFWQEVWMEYDLKVFEVQMKINKINHTV